MSKKAPSFRAYKFTFHANVPEIAPDLLNGKTPLEYIKHVLGDGYHSAHDLASRGMVKLMGWEFDFRPFMKRYVVNIGHSGWLTRYAPTKGILRKALQGNGKIHEIHEIPHLK